MQAENEDSVFLLKDIGATPKKRVLTNFGRLIVAGIILSLVFILVAYAMH